MTLGHFLDRSPFSDPPLGTVTEDASVLKEATGAGKTASFEAVGTVPLLPAPLAYRVVRLLQTHMLSQEGVQKLCVFVD